MQSLTMCTPYSSHLNCDPDNLQIDVIVVNILKWLNHKIHTGSFFSPVGQQK